RGAWAADRDAVGIGQQRLPEQRVGQDQRKSTLSQAFQGGSRANIHILKSQGSGVELQEEIQAEIDRCFALGHNAWSLQGMGKGH
ncbi:hypothetical protein, partial [Escherichia coli]|uniref:hypothetical protein n=1 Tax=Escherichia coli TaxID=562 RepID=UPI00136E5161